MTRVLITGASGFVGRQIMNELLKFDVKIIPVVRRGKERVFDGFPKIEDIILTHDLFAETEEWWAKQCREVDLIIHAAWYVVPGIYLESPQNIDCLVGSLNLARGAVKSGVKRFVGVGTCFEYDLSPGLLSVDTILKPLTPYAASKAALYLSLGQWLPKQSVQFAWCRLFYLYGQGEDERRLAPYIRAQLKNNLPVELTDGRQIRDFLDVEEAGRTIAHVALSEQTGPINICSGMPITVRQFAEKFANQYGHYDLLRFGARKNNLVDPPCVVGISNAWV